MTEEVVDALAIFRLTRLLVSDSFPPILSARYEILARFDAGSWQAELGACSWCMSVWIALVVVPFRRSPIWRRLLAPVLAASAVSGILSERFS